MSKTLWALLLTVLGFICVTEAQTARCKNAPPMWRFEIERHMGSWRVHKLLGGPDFKNQDINLRCLRVYLLLDDRNQTNVTIMSNITGFNMSSNANFTLEEVIQVPLLHDEPGVWTVDKTGDAISVVNSTYDHISLMFRCKVVEEERRWFFAMMSRGEVEIPAEAEQEYEELVQKKLNRTIEARYTIRQDSGYCGDDESSVTPLPGSSSLFRASWIQFLLVLTPFLSLT